MTTRSRSTAPRSYARLPPGRAVRAGLLDADGVAGRPRGRRRPQGGGGVVVGAGAGPRAGVGGGCGAHGAAAAGSCRQPAGGPRRQAGRGGHVQARLRVSPAVLLAGPRRRHRGGIERDLAAGQRRLQHRPRPHCRAGDGAVGAAKPARAQPILVCADTAGATHAFVDDIVGRKLWFSIGFPLEPDVKAAILAVPAPADGDDAGWVPALDQQGHERPGAWVRELSALDLPSQGWPVGTRAICRRERPHPGARHKMTFTDHTGPRFQVFITNQQDPDPATLEARHHTRPPHPSKAAGPTSSAPAALEVGHRAHARVEDRIRGAKATGLRNLPFADFDANDVWLTLVLVAQTLVCWAQALLLDGDLKVAEPKTLRYRLWHAAARLVRHARRVRLRFDRDWPWAAALLAAFARLRALPWPARCYPSHTHPLSPTARAPGSRRPRQPAQQGVLPGQQRPADLPPGPRALSRPHRGPVELGKTAEPIPLVNPASAGKPGQDVHTPWLREISRLSASGRISTSVPLSPSTCSRSRSTSASA